MVRNAKQLVIAAQQAEIDPPRIDAHAGDAAPINLARRLEAAGDVLPEAHQRPMHVAGRVYAAVVEPINLFQIEPAAIKQSRHDAATGGAQIGSKEDL